MYAESPLHFKSRSAVAPVRPGKVDAPHVRTRTRFLGLATLVDVWFGKRGMEENKKDIKFSAEVESYWEMFIVLIGSMIED